MMINLLLLVSSLFALAPSALSQFGQQHPCTCDGDRYFQLQSAVICNWNTVDQYMMYMGQDVNFGTFPFGGCTGWFTGPMRCACTHIKLYWDSNPNVPDDYLLSYWMPKNMYYPPGSTFVWEWPVDSKCQEKSPGTPPYEYWWQIQQIDSNSNRFGEMQCVIGAKILPWTSWVPRPVYPPYINYPQYTVAPDMDLSTASRSSAQSRSSRGPIDLNSTEVLSHIHAQINARRQQVDEAELAFQALDSDNPYVNKDFVRRMIVARNLTRPVRR